MPFSFYTSTEMRSWEGEKKKKRERRKLRKREEERDEWEDVATDESQWMQIPTVTNLQEFLPLSQQVCPLPCSLSLISFFFFFCCMSAANQQISPSLFSIFFFTIACMENVASKTSHSFFSKILSPLYWWRKYQPLWLIFSKSQS